MRPYNIKPLDFSANEACKTVNSVIRITHEKDGWNVWVDGCTWCLCPYPTFKAAVEAANEIHRKAVEKFLEPARVSVEPIGEKHRDGNPYLTNEGWVMWLTASEARGWGRNQGWFLCSEGGNLEICADEGLFGVSDPTLVITIHP